MDPYLQRLANQLPYQIAKEHADSLLGKIWEKNRTNYQKN